MPDKEMPKYGSAQKAPDLPWQPFNAPSPYQLSERLPQSWRYIQNKRSVCVRLKWACSPVRVQGSMREFWVKCFALLYSSPLGPKKALPPAVILCPMGLLGGLTSHKHKQAKDADSQQEAERRNTTTAKALTAETYSTIFTVCIWQTRLSKVVYTAFKF